MALVKRGKTWHTHFFVDGQRFRQSLETSDWREAQTREKKLIAAAEAGKLSVSKQEFARLTFREAAERFLQGRVAKLAPLSLRREQEAAKILNRKLGNLRVSRIGPETILAYLRERKAEGRANRTVNRELDVVRGVLKKAKRWHLFADEVRKLPVREEVGRALLLEEKLRLLKVAASRPEWQNAAYAAVLALNTTMRACEIKGLRWRDIDFMGKTLTVRKSKTEAGERVIPLTPMLGIPSFRSTDAHVDLVRFRPTNYVFPTCKASHFDPARPQTTWRTAWRNLRTAAGLPTLRFHDLRHHAITELAESQASDSTVMAIAGHDSPKMLQHYSHVRLQAKRAALDALSTRWADRTNSGRKAEGYDTNNDTKQNASDEQLPQVIEKMADPERLELPTSAFEAHCSIHLSYGSTPGISLAGLAQISQSITPTASLADSKDRGLSRGDSML
jgi:integrase